MDDSDYEEMNRYTWCASRSYGDIYYAYRKVNRTQACYMHRILAGAVGKDKVDHIDGNTLNNQRFNLRVVSHSLNILNMRDKPERGITYLPSGKWRAQLVWRGNRVLDKCFLTREEAKEAYLQAKRNILDGYVTI